MHGIQRDCPHFLRQVIHIVHHVIHNRTIFGALSLCITCGRRSPRLHTPVFHSTAAAIFRRGRRRGRQDSGADSDGRAARVGTAATTGRRDGGADSGRRGVTAATTGQRRGRRRRGDWPQDAAAPPRRAALHGIGMRVLHGPGVAAQGWKTGGKPVDGRRSAAPDGRCRRVVPEGVCSAAARPGFRGRNRGAARAVVLSAARARPVGGQRRGDGAPARYTARSRLCSSMSSLSATRAMNSPLVGLSFLP